MTALTYPRALPDEIAGGSFAFVLEPQVEVSPLRYGRQVAVDLGPEIWTAHYESLDLWEPRLSVARAWVSTMPPTKTFEAWDRTRPYPLAYRNFTGLTVSGSPFNGTGKIHAVAGNLVECDLTTLPVGFILSIGDYFSFDYGSSPTSRALHRIVKGGTVNGSGLITVEVRPSVRVGWSVDAVIQFYKPSAVMIMRPGSYSERMQFARRGVVSFDAVQSL